MLKKLALVTAICIALPGCAYFKAAEGALSVATTSVANPVTPAMEAQAEATITVVFEGLVAYRSACQNGQADKNCWSNIAAIQKYTRLLPPYITQLRAFLKSGDQVNAISVYNQLVTLKNNAVATAQALGVNLGG